MSDEQRPVTSAELDTKLETLRGDLRGEITSAMEHTVTVLIRHADQWGERLSADLKQHTDQRGERLSADLKQHTDQWGERLSADLKQHGDQWGERLSADLARSSRAGAEENRRELIALDDRYRDLPSRVTLLERDLAEHRGDTSLHPAPRTRRRPK